VTASAPIRSIPLGLTRALALALGLAVATPACAARYALVIGIDDYQPPVPSLHGAVNDARDIAAALAKAGAARIVLLLDRQATKTAITSAWTSLLEEASPGDTLIFTYAGHGSQEPARPGDPEEPDGLDENFPLAGYGPGGPALAERIVDNEVAQWLHDAEAKKVHVIFVADACHSGTMYRSVSLGVTYRAAPRLAISREELLKFAPPAPVVSEAIGPNDDVTFLAGVSDDRLVPEVVIDGVERGALSFAFARALEGAADADGDGIVTERELVSFVRATVQQRTESQQLPQSFPPVSRGIPLFDERKAGSGPSLQAVEASEASAAAALLTLAFRGGGGPPSVPGARIVASEAEADLVYDVAARTVEKRVAGVVAEDVAPEALGGIVAKWRALAVLKAASGRGVVPFEVASGPRTYSKGEKLTVELPEAPRSFMTLFNLPPNGEVEFLYPASESERNTDWQGKSFSLPLQVRDPPFGAEHLVAILSDRPLDELQAALKGLQGADAAATLPDVLRNAFEGVSVTIGIADIFTSAGG
jgi:hypothetical protein